MLRCHRYPTMQCRKGTFNRQQLTATIATVSILRLGAEASGRGVIRSVAECPRVSQVAQQAS